MIGVNMSGCPMKHKQHSIIQDVILHHMDFFPKHLTEYIEHHSSAEDPLLAELNRQTHLRCLMPQMVSGHQQGLFLELISSLMQPRCILEVGTFTGYSALCLAKGLAVGGVLHTIDVNAELEPIVEEFFAKSGRANQLRTYWGAASEIIPGIEGPFDLVFIDADKENYSLYYDLVIERLRPGGLILADNVLWSGKVTDPKHSDTETVALRAFAQKVAEDPRVHHMILSLRDGISVIRKY
jgi:caffeoyl-CoA O-methyltransferase